jgi:hypothetical protein
VETKLTADRDSLPNPGIAMPRYRCHKEVHALQIKFVTDDVMHFVLSDMYAPHQASETLFARYRPQPGDYFVVYDDGYESISPRQAFEDGYRKLDAATSSGRDSLPQALDVLASRLDRGDQYALQQGALIRSAAATIRMLWRLIGMEAAADAKPDHDRHDVEGIHG